MGRYGVGLMPCSARHVRGNSVFHTFAIDVNYITSFKMFTKIIFIIVLASNLQKLKFENPDPET